MKRLSGIGTDADETDVSGNKYKYLADAILGEHGDDA
jgi:hypothetical protein